MKKIIGLLLAGACLMASSTFASGDVSTGTTTTGSSGSGTVVKKEIVVCIKTAALTREGYLQSAYRTFSDAIMVAYLRRSEAIKAAYESGKSMKEIRGMIRTAFDTWKEKVKTAREALKKERKDRWEDFKEDVKACRPDRNTSKEATQDASGQERSEGSSL